MLDDKAREWLGVKGHDRLFGKLVKGGVVTVSVKDDKLDFTFEEAAAPPPPPAAPDEPDAPKEPEYVE